MSNRTAVLVTQEQRDELEAWLRRQTSLQPRTRKSPTLAAKPGLPVRVEHEYERKGALNLFAAFDTRTGQVYAHTAERKRQKEFPEFLEQLDREIPGDITKIHLVMDNLRMHTGKQVQAWLEKHPRFQFHHPPVHCSWMNQVEQSPTSPTRRNWPSGCTRLSENGTNRLTRFSGPKNPSRKSWSNANPPPHSPRESVPPLAGRCT